MTTEKTVVDGLYMVREVGGLCDGDTLVRASCSQEAANRYAAKIGRILELVWSDDSAKDSDAIAGLVAAPRESSGLFGDDPRPSVLVFRVLAL